MRVALVVVVVLLVLVALAYWALYRRPLPRVAGELRVAGLRGPVRIVRDGFGVPHVDAATMQDAAFAMGYVHAQDRGWQLELHRRLAAGRISEFAGAEALETDRFMRRIGLRRVAEEEERLLEGDERRMLEAYAAGVNAVLQGGGPRPLELTLLRLRPEPWRPADSLAFAKVMSLGLSLNWDNELQRLQLVRALGPELAARLQLTYPDTNPTILAAATEAVPAGAGAEVLAAYRALSQWLPPSGSGGGSNSWVVGGALTASGRPMLCNDPHLPPSVPSIWYEAHIGAGEDFESAGVTLPGLPFVVIGHNRRCAWGFTNSYADVQDLVVEELDSPQGRRHRTESGWADSTVLAERIRVKGAPDVVEEVVLTRHGPLVERLRDVPGQPPRALALQWTALTPGTAARALLGLQRASDWASFRRAAADFESPSQNAVYADVDGHIGYIMTGRIPARRTPPPGVPVPGWTGEARWERFLELDELPQVLDPPEQLIVTANNRVVARDFPFHISDDYMNGYRALRITELLRGRRGVDASFMAAAQLDVVGPPAREVVRLLADLRFDGPAEEARRTLAGWDAVLRPDAVEPSLYQAFMRRLARHALEPSCGELWRLVNGEMGHPVFGFAGNITGRLTPVMLRWWREDDRTLLGDGRTWDDVARLALADAAADLRRLGGRGRARWGRLHALPLAHALGVRRPLNLLFNAGTLEVGGDTDTVMQTGFIPSQPYATRGWAPSWRQIVDVGAWDACTGVHLPGQSGHPGSRHYSDLAGRWLNNHQHPLHWSPEAVAAAAQATLVLVPAAPA